jgi:hypothetical protein
VKFYPHFVTDGVYLKTETGELIGRLDKPGEPFESLKEARDKADWLEMVLQLQQSRLTQSFEQAVSPLQRSARPRATQACN